MNNLKRPIFGIFQEKIKIGQLFDLQDECFLESSILKTELSPAIRVYDEKCVKIEVFNRPFFAEFISTLSDDSFTQFKAHSNIGIFKTLTTDPRIFSPNSDALISIKFTFRKKVLKLNDLDSNALELDEKFIAKSQFAITEIEMGQWILVSVSAKSNLENNVLKLELIQEFLESYFTNPESSEIPNEASDFLYKFVTSETINLQQKNPSVSFKEFFESLKRTYEKHRCFPISVKLTSLLDLGFFTIDNRLETLQNSKFNSHKYFLKFFRESEMAIFKLQKILSSHLKIFSVIILKKLRQSEICLTEIMKKFKKISIYDKSELEFLQSEIENLQFLQSIETFIQNLETQFSAKQSNFIELQTQNLFNLSPKNVKFVLIIGENEKQKIDFINFLINLSQCSTVEEAKTYKMTTFLSYSNVSTLKSIVLTKNEKTTIFITIKGMNYYSEKESQKIATNEFSKIFRCGRNLNSVILLFSQSTQLKFFEKWIPKQISKATNNFIYFNFYNKKSLKAHKWKSLAEILPSGSLYFLQQKILKQNFIQMLKTDLEIGIQNIHQILRKINQSKIIDGIEEGENVMEYVKEILEISKDLIEQNIFEFKNFESDAIIEKNETEKVLPIFITNSNLCKFTNDSNITNIFANKFFTSPKYFIIFETVMTEDTILSQKETKNVCDEIIALPIFVQIYQQKLSENSKTDIISYNCETKSGISFFDENLAFSLNNENVFEKY